MAILIFQDEKEFAEFEECHDAIGFSTPLAVRNSLLEVILAVEKVPAEDPDFLTIP